MANDAEKILKTIKDEEIEWVDLRFTDPKGKWQHLTMCAGLLDDDQLTDGLMFFTSIFVSDAKFAGCEAGIHIGLTFAVEADFMAANHFSGQPPHHIFKLISFLAVGIEIEFLTEMQDNMCHFVPEIR